MTVEAQDQGLQSSCSFCTALWIREWDREHIVPDLETL